jgi:DNA polymerase-3 subunit delta
VATKTKTTDLFAGLTLITGPEQFLSERTMTRLIAQARAAVPDAAVTTAAGAELTPGMLDQMANTDLFSTATLACVTSAEKTPKDLETNVVALAKMVPDNVALIIAHGGGNQGKALLNKLTGLARNVLECPVIKPWKLAQFVSQEVADCGKTIESKAAQSLVDAVGQDLRSLAAATRQLVADTDEPVITGPIVAQYFAGRSSITSYAVADDALAGKVGDAIMELRWALSTGVAHVLITSALASSLRQMGNYLALSRDRQPSAADIGVPPWKMKDVAAASRAWNERTIASAIRAVAHADAQIKGAAQDPDFALEQLIIRLSILRRSAARRD